MQVSDEIRSVRFQWPTNRNKDVRFKTVFKNLSMSFVIFINNSPPPPHTKTKTKKKKNNKTKKNKKKKTKKKKNNKKQNKTKTKNKNKNKKNTKNKQTKNKQNNQVLRHHAIDPVDPVTSTAKKSEGNAIYVYLYTRTGLKYDQSRFRIFSP